MKDWEIIDNTKAGSLKRMYLLVKNIKSKPFLTDNDRFIVNTFYELVKELDELILYEIEDK